MEEVTLKEEDVRFSLPSELAAAGNVSIPSHYEPVPPALSGRGPSAGRKRCRKARQRCSATIQHDQGYWWADLTADTTLESDYILLQLWLYPPVEGVWKPHTQAPDRQSRHIHSPRVSCRTADSTFIPDGPAEVSATVKAYFALKVAGIPADDPRMARARERDSRRWAVCRRPTATSS